MISGKSTNLLAASGVFVLSLLLNGCCSAPEDKFPMPVAPDYACQSGADMGYEFFVWDCHQNRRVVIYQFTAWASCKEPQKQTAPCGEATSIEREQFSLEKPGFRLGKYNPTASCREIRNGSQWKTKELAR